MQLQTEGTLAGHYADGAGHTSPARACACHTRRIVEAFDTARRAMRESDYLTEAAVDAFNAAIVELETRAWDRGVDFASAIRERENAENAELLQQVALRLRGKDRADGVIRTETYPDPAIYSWTP